ncbi:glycosyltransferase family 2 protein [Desulfosporosinus orientis]|nr:glycosyltransferase family 2 protein [Desulfosporosinus orientis]
MERPLISIIVPVYKVEKYINKCVASLLVQTYENCEIVLVDDGSPDQCPLICDQFSRDFDNITALHKPNGGLGDARNYGVRYSKGDWIVFVDSDDYVEPTYIEDLWNLLLKHDADMAMASSIQADEDGNVMGKKLHFESICVSGADAIFEVYAGDHVGWSAYNNIYPKSVLLQYPFPAGYYEDMACMYLIVDAVDKVAIGDYNQNYKYVQHTSGSILNSALSEKHMHAFEICEEFATFIDEKYPELEILKPLIYIQSVVQMLHRQHMGYKDYSKVFLMYRIMFRKALSAILKNAKIKKKTKMFAFLLSTEPWIYKVCHVMAKGKKKVTEIKRG